MMSMLLAAAALAGPPVTEAPAGQSALRLPGAAEFPAGGWAIEAGADSWVWPQVGGFRVARGTVAYAVSDRVSLSVSGGGLNEYFYGYLDTHGVFSGTVRFQVPVNDTLRVATWVRPTLHTGSDPSYPLQSSTAIGVSIEGGGEFTRLDVSLPLACVDSFAPTGRQRAGRVTAHAVCRSSMTDMPELGVSALFGGGHRVRVGGIYPTVSYGYFGKHVYGEAGVGMLGLNARLGVRY